MTRRAFLLIFSLLVSTAAGTIGGTSPAQQEARDRPYVILVSLDGFRADYFDRFEVTNIRQLAARGARARWMRPVFPTLTFPNHYSLVTGLHPDRHGIVNNNFHDPGRRGAYEMRNPRAVTDGSWYAGEPIWVSAEKQGVRSACFFWPGSEAAIKGVRPSIWNKYDGSVPNDQRVQTVLQWLQLPEAQRPHLITLYFSELDTVQHERPMQAPEIEQAAKSLDRSIGLLMAGVARLDLRDRVYIIVTSDHGMVETTAQQQIRLTSLMDTSDIVESIGGPVASLHVRPGRAVRVRDTINARLKHGRAYLRSEVPERLHYRDNPRAGDVVVIMDESWQLVTRALTVPRILRPRWGMHGWDNTLESMRALFIVSGPGVRAGTVVDEVDNVDVYPLMTELLGITPAAEIDGRPNHIRRQIMD
jgi:predicted AlkP superfamily pyrophosphatase or phosphodiesterase